MGVGGALSGAGLDELGVYVIAEGIILGGGVMRCRELLPLVRRKLKEMLNGYVQAPKIVAPALGDNAGVLGAIALAQQNGWQ